MAEVTLFSLDVSVVVGLLTGYVSLARINCGFSIIASR